MHWPDEYIRDYDIYNSSGGYSGELGKSISTILIFGDENYRNSDTHGIFHVHMSKMWQTELFLIFLEII